MYPIIVSMKVVFVFFGILIIGILLWKWKQSENFADSADFFTRVWNPLGVRIEQPDTEPAGRTKSETLNETQPESPTDPTVIRRVLDQDNYDLERQRISMSKTPEPASSLRYWLDEWRHSFVKDIPFAPGSIKAEYRDVALDGKYTIGGEPMKDSQSLLEEPLNRIQEERMMTLDTRTGKYQKDYCIQNPHKEECVRAERKWRCFGRIEARQDECESDRDIVGNRVEPGYWDRPCVVDEECPFFQANRNYTNRFGGCQRNGMCELPKGVEPLGYRGYKRSTPAYCYNCPTDNPDEIRIDTCCAKQKSPDYMFVGDTQERLAHLEELDANGLSTLATDSYAGYFQKLEQQRNAELNA